MKTLAGNRDTERECCPVITVSFYYSDTVEGHSVITRGRKGNLIQGGKCRREKENSPTGKKRDNHGTTEREQRKKKAISQWLSSGSGERGKKDYQGVG